MALDQSRRLVSQSDAAIIQGADVPRSKFTGSWSWKSTFDAGLLIPFLVQEVLPGDHLRYEITAYLRMNTPIFPMMDSQRVDTHVFFVPDRLTWSNFNRFMGEQDNPTDSIDYTVPYIQSPNGGFPPHSVYDHMGLPTSGGTSQMLPLENIRISALPLRAYYLIYHEWFRDQNVINSSRPPLGNGPDTWSDYILRRRAKSADYFTSALPWPQRFNAPGLAVGGLAPVKGIALSDSYAPTVGGPAGWTETGGTSAAAWAYSSGTGLTLANNLSVRAAGVGVGSSPAIYADLSAATGLSINAFRQAFLVQQLLERDARGGTRYTEIVKSHFRVTSPDMRLQRPEYIGGGSSPMNLTPVAQTAPGGGNVVGSLGAAGTSVGAHTASYAATEHGYIIGLISVKSELSYSQGLKRHWTRFTRLERYWPSLAQLGEQPIFRKEIHATGNDVNDDLVFGYQEAWHEYRTEYSTTHGYFRSTASGTLDAWHLGQYWSAAPTLSREFLEDIPPMERVLAAADLAENQQYLADVLIRREATRPIPTFGTPATLGRF